MNPSRLSFYLSNFYAVFSPKLRQANMMMWWCPKTTNVFTEKKEKSTRQTEEGNTLHLFKYWDIFPNVTHQLSKGNLGDHCMILWKPMLPSWFTSWVRVAHSHTVAPPPPPDSSAGPHFPGRALGLSGRDWEIRELKAVSRSGGWQMKRASALPSASSSFGRLGREEVEPPSPLHQVHVPVHHPSRLFCLLAPLLRIYHSFSKVELWSNQSATAGEAEDEWEPDEITAVCGSVGLFKKFFYS